MLPEPGKNCPTPGPSPGPRRAIAAPPRWTPDRQFSRARARLGVPPPRLPPCGSPLARLLHVTYRKTARNGDFTIVRS